MESKDEYYCKLLDKIIELGLCLDINYEREHFFKAGVIEKLNKTLKETDEACKSCPYYPFK